MFQIFLLLILTPELELELLVLLLNLRDEHLLAFNDAVANAFGALLLGRGLLLLIFIICSELVSQVLVLHSCVLLGVPIE